MCCSVFKQLLCVIAVLLVCTLMTYAYQHPLTLSQANIIEKVEGKLDEDTRASLLSCKAQSRDMGK